MYYMESEKAQVYSETIPILPLFFPFNVLLKTGVFMTYFTVAVISALCLLLASTRKYSVIGMGMLLYFYPVITIGVLLLAGIAYFIYRRKIA